jgi:hypothetical protein
MNEDNAAEDQTLAFKCSADRKEQIGRMAAREHRNTSNFIKSILYPELDRRDAAMTRELEREAA